MRNAALVTVAFAALLAPGSVQAQLSVPPARAPLPALPNPSGLLGGSGIGAVGAGGVSIGGVSVGGVSVGGVSVGGVGAGGVSVGGVGAGGGGAGAGAVGGGGFGAGSAGPATTGSISTGTATGIGASPGSGFGSVPSIALPAALAPCGDEPRRRGTVRISPCGPRYTAFFPEIGSVSGTREDVESFRNPLQPRGGTPQRVVQDCRAAIVAAALPYGVVRVDAASAGPLQSARGGLTAPVEFRIVYNRRGGLETRQATINCRMNTAGRVISAA